MTKPWRGRESQGSYSSLLRDFGFQAFLWTQFLGAFNDNVYKMIVSIVAVEIAANSDSSSRYLALAGAVFVLPFLLFAGHAGQLADRFSKTRVLQITKALEMAAMLLGIAALLSHRIEPLLAVLFLLAAQANFFSPAKYGILPEMMGEAQLSRANGLIELSTFAAIVLGASFGTLLFERWRGEPAAMGLVLLMIAVAGSAASLGITRVPASGSREPFHWNPFHEIRLGAQRLRESRALWLAVLGISYFWFIGALFQMALLLVGRETLHIPESQVGLLVAALAVGIGVGSLAAGWFSGDRVELGLTPFGSAALGASAIALGFTHSFPWAIVWLLSIGFSGGLFIVPLNAFLQERAGAAEKGRILATNNFVNMLGVILASGLLWLLHDWFRWNPGEIIAALGAFTMFATAAAVWLWPEIALRFLLWILIHALFRIRIEGAHALPRHGGALLVSNHVSFADALLIGCATPRSIRFLMWRPYFDAMPFTPFFRVLKAIPLPAGSGKETLRALIAARRELERGSLVAIFPEGGITRTGELQPFQRGVEKLVDGSGLPVFPVYLQGLWGHPLSMKGGGLFRNWSRPLRPLVTVRIGDPKYGAASAAELESRVHELAEAVEIRT